MHYKIYPADLADEEWPYIGLHIRAPTATGRPRIPASRETLDAVFYLVRSAGCQQAFVIPGKPARLQLVGCGAGRRSATFGNRTLGVTRHSRASPSPLTQYQHRTIRPPKDLLGEARPEDSLEPRPPLTLGHDQAGVDLFAEADNLLLRSALSEVGRRDGAPELLFYMPRLSV